ncbi:Na(+)/H(+) antiporter subunit D [compost metagenome]
MLALAGIPPLSGFMGKILIGQGAVEGEAYILLALSLISSIFVLYSLLRIFLNCFWGETTTSEDDVVPMSKGWIIPCVLLTVASIGLGFGAEFISPYVSDAARTLTNPYIYIDAVMGK